MSKGFLETPLGTLEITAESGKIIGIELMGDEADYVEACRNVPEGDVIEKAKKQLTEYFDGNRQTFNLELELRGTDFQKRIWQALLTIPYGKTMNYAQAAEAAGCPGGQRAAGSAIGKNPLLIVVPCHRVIRADGTLGDFSCGTDKKQILHGIENIKTKKGRIRDEKRSIQHDK